VVGGKDVIKKDLKEMGTSWEGVKREALNRYTGRVYVAMLFSGGLVLW